MFKRLKQRWQVNNWNLFFILCTFAITGTLTAYISKEITAWLDVPRFSFSWWTLKIAVLLIGYQLLILLFGFLFGQFQFFWKFERKILAGLGLLKPVKVAATANNAPFISSTPNRSPVNIAIFASGRGSNAEKIIEHFRNSVVARVSLIVTDQPAAGVLEIARRENIPSLLLDRDKFFRNDAYVPELKKLEIGFIVLAGFMRKIPAKLIAAYPRRIVNIHPALLPSYGGKGMYGDRVHHAVIAAKEKQSGITIHFVDEIYDNGEIIFQDRCDVNESDTPELLAAKVHALEHKNYPAKIEEVIREMADSAI